MLTLRLCAAVALLLCCWANLAGAVIKNPGWWRNTVFYQIYPRSFMDSNDDGIGDLKGITMKLQHFKDSGIGAIWLSPIYASPMVDFGYDISDFRDIEPDYGTMKDLEELTKKAKEMGIKVIMDLVPNHTSDKHDWFVKSFNGIGKYKDYYIWRGNDSSKLPNNWISVFSGPAWTYNKTRGMHYFHQFEYRQPDLNYANPDVRQEMEEIIRFWLSKGIDGFRVDAIPHVYENDDLLDEPRSNDPNAGPRDYGYLNHIYTKDDQRSYDLIQSWRKILDDWAHERDEDEKVIMTEAYTSLVNTTKFYDYGSHVPFNFNFIMSVNNKSTAAEFKSVIDDWMSHTPKPHGVANWVMGNHDRSRTATRYPGRADQMTMLAMILPGIAVTYNGEEIAMEDKLDISWEETMDPQACNTDPEHYKSRTRDPNRTPFQWDNSTNAGFSKANTTWLPVHENYPHLNLDLQKKDYGSHYWLYKNLTSLRASSDTLKHGELMTEVLNNGKALAVVRKNVESPERIILVINFLDAESQEVDVSKFTNGEREFDVILSSQGSGATGTKTPTNKVKLQAKASVILRGNDAPSFAVISNLLIIFGIFANKLYSM
ncbi:maltase 1-like [Trichogramma pretiosum]|uniref:maltase 1-like n=1 Tax=Trichogramma pretiosum TaxID=7493 RepID=UPI0006C9868A|nr:maltase 1-like [Trichogramma pretiosum]